jgi:hypothetical protein
LSGARHITLAARHFNAASEPYVVVAISFPVALWFAQVGV